MSNPVGRPRRDVAPKLEPATTFFSVIGSVKIASTDYHLRLLRDRLVPLLRELGLTPLETPVALDGTRKSVRWGFARVSLIEILYLFQDNKEVQIADIAKLYLAPFPNPTPYEIERAMMKARTAIHTLRKSHPIDAIRHVDPRRPTQSSYFLVHQPVKPPPDQGNGSVAPK